VSKVFAAVLLVVAAAAMLADDAVPPEVRLERGIGAYKAGDHAAAVADLAIAEQAFRAETPDLPSLQTALVYLALAQFRLEREDDARETLLRLHAAERIAPAFASLSLGTDASEVEALAALLLPAQPLPAKVLPSADQTALPAIILKQNGVHSTESPALADAHRLLRAADAAAEAGRLDDALQKYASLVQEPATSRSLLMDAAIGLYRLGAYSEAVEAFRRIGEFARGDEDLRYYFAVSLWETAAFAEARLQLACALPSIQETEEVVRYRERIARGGPSSRIDHEWAPDQASWPRHPLVQLESGKSASAAACSDDVTSTGGD